jgi:hypothetical protein
MGVPLISAEGLTNHNSLVRCNYDMKNITLTKDFFLGGKATFTVQNNQTGEHRTYKIRKPEPTAQWPNPAWFIKQMTGTDNESHYSYIGKIDPQTGAVTLTRASKFSEGSPVVKAARWVVSHVILGLQVPDQIDIRHAGKCGRCGRTLTTPESLTRGVGPECWEKMGN